MAETRPVVEMIYDELYSGPGTRRDKSVFMFRALGSTRSMHLTAKHDVHRIRRAGSNSYFSKRLINHLEPVFQLLASKLQSRVQEFRHSKQPPILNHAFAAPSTDGIITLYSFGKSYNELEKPEFADGDVQDYSRFWGDDS